MVAAVSGGADSLALAFAVAYVCSSTEQPFAAVTVDHGLQDGSADRARAVRDQLVDLGYDDITITRVSVGTGSGPEAEARTARYAVLDHEAAGRGADLVLGHTLDDQAETVLLGLARGSGPRSLAGMSVRSGHRLRPLLGIRRARTRAACAELGLDFWDDPHNADPRFTRSRLRARVLPVLESELGPGIAEALARTADLVRADADLLDRLADDLLASARWGSDLDCAVLAGADAALQTRVIKSWLTSSGATETSYERIRAVAALITDWHGQGPIDLPGLTVQRRGTLLTPEPQ
ncbi:tRNA(Ile)-lysidine synthase [Microlunatus endophyticus]|uniref:tRNA(Ile)-lysidine synthase n=2 Tax=Microlunatus endophyticus TaxID=1716077 RepID=A0A917S552_9ACTN|nr:tRNA(Ile)-lysidine synthase [Microlunatus endophyticus]